MTTNVAAAIHLFKTAFPGRVTTPDTASQYEAAVAGPWSQTCWTPAAAYVHLTSTQDVVQALTIIKKTECKFAIRAAGHNPNVGFNCAYETGVVLDIRRLQSRSLGTDGVARIGAGNTWGDVYAWLEERELSAVGGRDKEVGLAGFLLGGGLGAFPNLHGLGADGVRSLEVVLADGTIVNANAETNPDLYRALKGGGSNFGIVTRFDLNTHPLVNVQYTINKYESLSHVEVVAAAIAMQKKMEMDPKIGLFVNFNHACIVVGLMYADGTPEEPEAFEPFHEIRELAVPLVVSRKGTLLSLAEAMGHDRASKKQAICTVTSKVSHDLYTDVHKSWLKACEDLPAGAYMHYTIQPVGTAGVQAGEDRGGNTLGLERVPQCWWVFTCSWPKDGSDDIAAQKVVNSMAQEVQALAGEKGLLLEYLSMSFANASQKVLRSYGADNVKRLQEAAAKYDPEGVFQKLQNDGFLLRNSI